MEKKDTEVSSSRVLPYEPIIQATRRAITYIDDRRKGLIRPLITPWKKMNQVTMGGLEFGQIIMVGGMSGTGKTTWASQLEDGLQELNPHTKLSFLNFTFEMASERLVGKKLSAKVNLSAQEMYSAHSSLRNESYDLLVEEAMKFKDRFVYYVDIPGSVEQIKDTIYKFSEETFNKDRGIIIFLDHTLLVKGRDGEKEREMLYNLMAAFNEVKKKVKCVIILLTQLNRDIESSERIQNASMHAPRKSDVSSADAGYMYSDIVLIIHRPEMLGLKSYTTSNWPTANMVFVHYLKVRFGEPCVAAMVNDLAHNKILDYIPPQQ